MEKINKIIENKELAYRITFILMFLWGVAMSFLVPPWQTPDEIVHLDMIGQSLGVDGMAQYFFEEVPLDDSRIRFDYTEKIDMDEWEAALTKSSDYAGEGLLAKGIRPSVIKYLPAALGIELGVLFRLPAYWVLHMGELFSLVFYVLIGILALRLLPVKKEVLLTVMLFPMSMQQAASFNYDSVLLPLCFLFVAYIFHLRMTKEKIVWSDMAIVLLLLLVIVYIKIPYLFLGLLIFLFPREKIHLKIGKYEIDGDLIRRWRFLLLFGFLALCGAGIFVLRNNYWIRLVGGLFLEFPRTVYLLYATARSWCWYLLVSSVGMFGWLDSQLPAAFIFVTYIFLILIAVWGEEKPENYGIKAKTSIWLIFVACVQAVFIVFSMVNHTITITLYGVETMTADYNIREALYQIPYIGGLQGRYFLPFLTLPFLALPTWKKPVKGKAYLVLLFEIVSIILTVSVLYKRYWAV